MKLWIVYCALKDVQLKKRKDRFDLDFEKCISEIANGNYLVILSPSSQYANQKSFLIMYDGYPVVVPFHKRLQVVQLITFFPDRRYKNG
jgi:hypothetical protein